MRCETAGCERLACTKPSEGITGYCIAHGGGRRCQEQGCAESARGGSRRCVSHGGVKQCEHEGCTKSQLWNTGARDTKSPCSAPWHALLLPLPVSECQSSTGFSGHSVCFLYGKLVSTDLVAGFCIAHGGGKPCQVEGCTKSAQGNTMLCIAHGGGRRCREDGCVKLEIGNTGYCRPHVSGKMCKYNRCSSVTVSRKGYCRAHDTGTESMGHTDHIAQGECA